VRVPAGGIFVAAIKFHLQLQVAYSLMQTYPFRVKACNDFFGVRGGPHFAGNGSHFRYLCLVLQGDVCHNKPCSMTVLPILLVDDEPQVRSFVKTVLLRQGFRVLEAADGLAAFSIIQDFHGQFSLVVSDIGVPHLDGATLSRWVREQFPSLPVLLVSGGSDPDDYSEGSAFLAEPFCASQLIGAVKGLLSTS